MSKRGEQARKVLDRLEKDLEVPHPGESIGPVVSSRLRAQAWAEGRPAKKPITLREESAWLAELIEAGYDPTPAPHVAMGHAPSAVGLSAQQIALRSLDRCAAQSSAWTRHTVQEHATRIITEAGVRATGAELRELIAGVTTLAVSDCFSMLPLGQAAPDHVAHLTSVRVVHAETMLRDLITTSATQAGQDLNERRREAALLSPDLDAGQVHAAAAVASNDQLVVVEGAAGSGKTTMLATAILLSRGQRGRLRVVAPTKRAADVAHRELGVPTESVAALVHAHGWRWNSDGVWSRLTEGARDLPLGATYVGPSEAARLHVGERIVVDEAGMLDQDTATALFTIAAEAGATIALIGDRAQLPAVGRGGVLDAAADILGHTINMTEVHRFVDPKYAELTTQLRERQKPGKLFDELDQIGLILLHSDIGALHAHVAGNARSWETITTASNDEATALNDHIRDTRVAAGLVDDSRVVAGNDGLHIGAGDLIQTRMNSPTLGVTNRQLWHVQLVEDSGALRLVEAHTRRKHANSRILPQEYVNAHAHLAYASTAYGVQGVTAQTSHTVLSESMTGAALYVGMTRGRDRNQLHLIAENRSHARSQFVEAMERDRADRGLQVAAERAHEAVRGLIAEGPAKLVNDEIAALMKYAAHAEERAAYFGHIVKEVSVLNTQHRAEAAAAESSSQAAREELLATTAALSQPLLIQAAADAAELREAIARETMAFDRMHGARPMGRRRAQRLYEAAARDVVAIRLRVDEQWGDPTLAQQDIGAWASDAVGRIVDTRPAFVAAKRTLADAQSRQEALVKSQSTELRALIARWYGPNEANWGTKDTPLRPGLAARQWSKFATNSRTEAKVLRLLPFEDAVTKIATVQSEMTPLREQPMTGKSAELIEDLLDPSLIEYGRSGNHGLSTSR